MFNRGRKPSRVGSQHPESSPKLPKRISSVVNDGSEFTATGPAGKEPDCDRCDDTGWIRFDDGPGSGYAARCPCKTAVKEDPKMILRRCNMSAVEAEMATTPWDGRVAPPPDFVLEFAVAAALKEEGREWCLVLLGPPGRGKTKAAAMAMAAWCAHSHRSGLWVNISDDLPIVMQQRFEFGGFSAFEDEIKNASFLVLDELGVERDGARGSTVAEWIYYRHRRELPTLVTSNAATTDALGDGRISSRLGPGVVMRGQHDYRDFIAENPI